MTVVTNNVPLYHNTHKTNLGTYQGVEPFESVPSMEVIKDSIYDHWDIGFLSAGSGHQHFLYLGCMENPEC